MALPPKQAIFVAEYIIDFSGARAARAAGYSERTAAKYASELLEKPEIQAAIREHQALREKRTLITADKVLTDIEDIKRDAMEQVTRDGRPAGMRNHQAALKAAELQGKHLAMFSDKLQVTGAIAQNLSAEEAAAYLATLERKLAG